MSQLRTFLPGGHQKPVRYRAPAEARHDLQRVPVYGTQLVQFFLAYRAEQLMEPGKGQLGLGLHPGGAQHPGLGRRGRIGRRVQQHRLASARLTTEQQCRVIGRPIKECADQRALTATSEQNRRFFKSFQRGQPISEAGPPSMRVRRPHLRRDTSGCLPRGIPRARTYPAGPAPRTPATLEPASPSATWVQLHPRPWWPTPSRLLVPSSTRRATQAMNALNS